MCDTVAPYLTAKKADTNRRMTTSAVLRLTDGNTRASKVRFAKSAAPVDPNHAVAIAVFEGGDPRANDLTSRLFGANEGTAARVYLRRLRKLGRTASIEWIQCGAWAADLWTRDLTRPLGTHPTRFYGRLDYEPELDKACGY